MFLNTFLDQRWSVEKNNFGKKLIPSLFKNPEDSVLPALGKKLVCSLEMEELGCGKRQRGEQA